jgi:hypothetical protein
VDQASQRPSFLWIYAGALVLLAAVAVGLYLSRARLAGADGGPPPWRPSYPGVEYPPPYTRTVVSRPLLPALAALGLGLAGFLAFAASCYLTYRLG